MNTEIDLNDDKIQIYKGLTLSGLSINVLYDEYCLTINENDVISITDSFGEILIDKELIPQFDINNISNKEIKNIFKLSISYLNFIRDYSKQCSEENLKNPEKT